MNMAAFYMYAAIIVIHKDCVATDLIKLTIEDL